jgi:hypothetical protein
MLSMIHLLILAVHLLTTIAKLLRPGGVRAVVAESLLLRQQLVMVLHLNARSRRARMKPPKCDGRHILTAAM